MKHSCPAGRHLEASYACYKAHGCRCAECRAANSTYAKRRRRQVGYGRWAPLVDAEPSRRHIEMLKASGVGTRRLEETTGVSRSALRKISLGTTKRVTRETAAAILATPPRPAPGSTISGMGAARRLQALAAAGWSCSELARRLGWSVQNLHPIQQGRSGVWLVTHEAIDALFRELWDQAPPAGTPHLRGAATRARRQAARAGWLPAMAWDDIDDPDEQPVMGPERVTQADRILDLVDVGEPLDAIVRHIGTKPDHVRAALLRAGRAEDWARLRGAA